MDINCFKFNLVLVSKKIMSKHVFTPTFAC